MLTINDYLKLDGILADIKGAEFSCTAQEALEYMLQINMLTTYYEGPELFPTTDPAAGVLPREGADAYAHD